MLHQASYLRKKELVALDSGKQTTVGSGGFFVYRRQITRRKKGSQEDPLIFSLYSGFSVRNRTILYIYKTLCTAFTFSELVITNGAKVFHLQRPPPLNIIGILTLWLTRLIAIAIKLNLYPRTPSLGHKTSIFISFWCR